MDRSLKIPSGVSMTSSRPYTLGPGPSAPHPPEVCVEDRRPVLASRSAGEGRTSVVFALVAPKR